MTRCEVCNEGPTTTGVSLIRVNEKGVPGIWRCHSHATPEQLASRDPIVADIVSIIEEDNQRTALFATYRTAAPILARACNEKDAELTRLRAELAEEKRKVEAGIAEIKDSPHAFNCDFIRLTQWMNGIETTRPCNCIKAKALAALTTPSEGGESK